MLNSGIVRDNFDPGQRPQDDLYGHVNGKWLDSFEIPPDRGSDGAIRELRDLAERQVKEIIEAEPRDSLVGALYTSFMDAERVEALGLAPIVPELRAVEAAAGAESLAAALGGLGRQGVDGAVGLFVDTDPALPSRYVLNLHQGGIGLPDEAYYREDQHAKVRETYRQHIARMFALVAQGLDDADRLSLVFTAPSEAADRVFALERRLAAAHWDVVKDRDATATHNPLDFKGLRTLAPGFPWEEWVGGIAGPADPPVNWDALVVMEPSYLEALAVAWRDVPLEDWKLWGLWRVIQARSSLLPDAIVQASFDFYGRVLNGAEELRQRWKRGVSLVDGVLGEAVGRIYVARHFPPEHKARMVQLVADLIEAYRRSIEELSWLGPETKRKALDKLSQFTPKIGYPDKWRDYSALRLSALDLMANARAAAAFETDRELRKLSGPVDRTEWFMNPQTVNAYYNPGMNEIVFPAGILQPPMFDAAADDAANYGGIGVVIGHEIGHSFDDQ
ncbi:MAG: peptidase M13, partial [Bifidobacteriaceae bacterium]|nr:peptidase M13 [Bifidobacteriaceae bacterium]